MKKLLIIGAILFAPLFAREYTLDAHKFLCKAYIDRSIELRDRNITDWNIEYCKELITFHCGAVLEGQKGSQ